MTENTAQETHVQEETKVNDTENNFRKQQRMYEKMLEKEREEKALLQKQLEERQRPPEDDEDDDEPYVDRRKLEKKLSTFGQKTKQETESIVKQEVRQALAEERRQNWLKNNPDFYEVMNHAQKFAEKDPELAETILEMPDGFERQKLVYKNIKALGLHRPEEPKKAIQETVERNQRSPYYIPSAVGAPPYQGYSIGGKAYSKTEMKNNYDKMMQLKENLRI